MDNFPSRVTRFDDGVYRWSYDLNLWRNRYLLRLILKIISLILGIPTLFFATMALKSALRHPGLSLDKLMFYIREDLLGLAVVGGIWVGMIILTIIIYAVCAATTHGAWRRCFEMDESSVTLFRSAAEKKRNSTAETIADVVEIATLFVDKSDSSASSVSHALHSANQSGTTRFDSVRRVKLYPKQDLIDLRESFVFATNQIYVNAEDYPFVRDFILQRVREKARP